MTHKAGFVNIIGNPNAGKSTLMNALVGEKLSIITSKAQTTRHRIMGIVSGDDFQIVYSDTPGYLKPSYKLQESMMTFVESAFHDADIILFIVDLSDKADLTELVEKIMKSDTPVIIVLNKIDLSKQDDIENDIIKWTEKIPGSEVIPVAALHKFNIEKVFQTILDKLPESQAFFPKDTLTDKTQRFFTSEIIREKILLNFHQEIPYATEVAVEKFKEEDKIVRIFAYIYVTRDTQKGIILGHKGQSIKKIGTEARLDLEEWLDKKVFLELSVKVKKDWRDDDLQLKRFGYDS